MRRFLVLGAGVWKFFFITLAPAALSIPPPMEVVREVRRFKITFYCSCRICCGRHSPQRGGDGNTAMGHAPIPFRTVAVGDPELLGKWLYFQDLGGWVFASDTGKPCSTMRVLKRKGTSQKFWVGPCVAKNQVDVFVGGSEWHKAAQRLGVMEWEGRVK